MGKNQADEQEDGPGTPGRPTLADEAAEAWLQLRVTRKAKRELREFARKRKLNMSEVVRRELVRAKIISE